MSVMTVLGPVEPGALGVTLMHEHLVHAVEDRPLTDEALVASELAEFKAAGGGAVVDLTTIGIGGPVPTALVRIASATGLDVVAGTGFYIEDRVPADLRALSEDDLHDWLVRDLTSGFPGTSVRAGIIGEVGCGTQTSGDVTPFEERALRAAARAQRDTGAAITVHTQVDFGRQGLQILDILERAGADLGRVVLAHCDARVDPPYWHEIVARGASVEFSAIGRVRHEGALLDGTPVPGTDGRVAAVARLVEEGHAGRLLLSHDVCALSHLRRFGGGGYRSLLDEVVPRLNRAGVADDALWTMLIENPARLLDLR